MLRLRLEHFDRGAALAAELPRDATVLRPVIAAGGAEWMLAELDSPVEHDRSLFAHVLLRPRWAGATLGGSAPTSVFLRLVADPDGLVELLDSRDSANAPLAGLVMASRTAAAAPPPPPPRSASRPSSGDAAGEWPPHDVQRTNRVLDALERLAVVLLPYWLYPRLWPGRPSERRRLTFVAWLVVMAVLALLALGGWLTGSFPDPVPPR
jgi:hypothetical protein